MARPRQSVVWLGVTNSLPPLAGGSGGVRVVAPILTLILLVAVAIFAVENSGAVALQFAVWHFNSSLVYVLLGSVVVGMLAATIFWSGRLLALRRRLRELDARAKKADADLAALRNPLAAGTSGDGAAKAHAAKPATPGGI